MFLHKWLIPFHRREKWSTERIRQRYDADADLFFKLADGQKEVIDVQLMRNLLMEAASRCTPQASSLLDLGCGGGFYTEGLISTFPEAKLCIADLSREMLDNTAKKIAPLCKHEIQGIHGDMRSIELESESFDVITAAAVLHHLREEQEWHKVFSNLYKALKPQGSLWIADLVSFQTKTIKDLMDKRYSKYLSEVFNPRRAKKMMHYIELEDSPRSLVFQIELLKKVGFSTVEVLHANTNFAAFGAIKES